MPAPIRTCVATRQRRPQDQLLRLCLGADGLVHLDPGRRAPGRGAWVSPTADSLRLVTSRPGMLSRALRLKNPRPADLLAEARAALETRLLQQLRAAHRAGRARLDAGAEGAVLDLLAADAADAADAAGNAGGAAGAGSASIPALRLGLPADALGAALGRPPVRRITLLPCRATAMLAAALQEALELGYPDR